MIVVIVPDITSALSQRDIAKQLPIPFATHPKKFRNKKERLIAPMNFSLKNYDYYVWESTVCLKKFAIIQGILLFRR